VPDTRYPLPHTCLSWYNPRMDTNDPSLDTNDSRIHPAITYAIKHGEGAFNTSPKPWRNDFLNALRVHHNMSLAAHSLGIGTRTVYDEMARDPAYREAVQEARRVAVGTVESSFFDVARKGDTRAAQKILESHLPEEYDRPRKTQVDVDVTFTYTIGGWNNPKRTIGSPVDTGTRGEVSGDGILPLLPPGDEGDEDTEES
jgi:hypothetical protein